MGAIVQYVGEHDLWHARVLLRPCSRAVYAKVMSVAPYGPANSCWWVATPDGDIYPESFTVSADVEAFALFDWEKEKLVPRTMTPFGREWGPVYEFAPGRGPGDLTLVTFARAATAAEKFNREALASLEKPTRPGLNVWRCVAPGTSKWFNKAVTALADHVQGAELAALELVARAAQLIELRHREKNIGGFGNSADEDIFPYLDSGTARGLLAVSPLIEEYVASELSKDAATVQERRKAREERSAPYPKREAKGGGKA